ncbi:MAG: hypothetical protein K2Y37_16175 [Pirellulales bacterium]|nr:hypothetical protein [Pirellulales bacterium]
MLGFAPAQTALLVVWATLARSRLWCRLLVFGAYALAWVSWEENYDFMGSPWRLFLKYDLPIAAVVGAVLTACRGAGWRIQPKQCEFKSESRRWQFSLRHLVIAVAVVSVAFGIEANLHIFRAQIESPELGVVVFSCAAVIPIIVWAALGQSHLAPRAAGYVGASLLWVGLWLFLEPNSDLLEVLLTFVVPTLTILPLSLLAFRFAGYRLVRLATPAIAAPATPTN